MPHPHNLINPSRANHQDKQAATEQDSSELEIYQLKPPDWRLPTQLNRPELGYPGLHPTHPGQHEDAITKSLVQWGFSAQMLVSTESFSAHQMIYKKITDEAAFNVSSSALAALIEARRRYCAINSYDTESTIKVPGRVTLNEQKRENWLRELADSSVPLLKLSKNVPHGFKGEKLLEMLVSRKIDSSRATWYIRLIGLNEINAQRNKNELSHIRYTLSFTSDVCQFLQKQLAEVTVPLQTNLSSSTTSLITTSSRLAAMNVRSKPRSSTLSDPETRKHWVAKWNQSRMLLKRLYFESLLDQPTFFKWLIDQLRLANLAQINFLLEIHHSVLDRFNLSSNLVRGFVEACLFQIRFLERRLKLAVQSAFIFCPDNFVWPDIWISNKVLLEEIILANFPRSTDDISSLKHNSQTNQLREILKGDFYAVNWRVNELIGDVGVGTGIVGNIFRRRVQLVEILDSYTDYNDCSKLYYKYFLNPSVAGHIPVSFKDKLEVLLSWATTPLRTSDKRVHLVASTLSYVKHDYKKNGDEFQNILVGWLEQIESIEGGDLLVRLFSELSRRNIFSYGAYVQRMVAKGETECDIVAGKASGLQALLSEWMPLASSKSSRERSSSIKRSPGRDSARNGLMAIIADFNSAIASADYGRFTSLLKRRLDVRQATSANRKLLAEILPNALVHLVSELTFPSVSGSGFLVSKTANHPQMASALLTWGIQLLEACQAHATLFEIMQRIVQIDLGRLEALRSDERARADLSPSFQSTLHYLQVICMTASNNKEILEINGQLADFISRLFAIYVHFRRLIGGTFPVLRGFVRCLRNLVIESNAVDSQILEVLDKEYHPIFDEMMTGPSTGETLPSRTREILQLIQCPSAAQVSQLVLKYWEEYRSDMDWGAVLWNSLIAAIKIHSQEEFDEPLLKNIGEGVQNPYENWAHFREIIMQFCEDLDVLYEEGLIGCLIRAGYVNYPHPDDEALFSQPVPTSDVKMTSEEEEGEESEEIVMGGPSLKSLFFHNQRSLCRNIRLLLVELMSCGLISIEVGLEEYVIRPLADDVPQLLVNLCGDNSSDTQRASHTTQAEEALRQVKEIYELVNEALCEQQVDRRAFVSQSPGKESVVMMTPSHSRSDGHSSFTNQGTPEVSFKSKDVEHAIEEYVRAWKLHVERKLWFEQSDEGSAFCSRLLLSLLISIKTVSELSFDPDGQENPSSQQQESFEQLITKILDVFESLRGTVCRGSSLLRRQIPAQSAVFLNPILEFVKQNDLGTIFHTKLIHSIDELLPYSQPIDLVNQKYPYLESIFKATCIFNHAARTRQFQLHIRLLMSSNPPQMSASKEASVDLASTLGSLVEVMAKRLHLTDSKDASPFFLECLPAQVAEALIIKLSLYLGMSICKLLGPNPSDSALEVLRIHHISRCITTLTNQLTIRTYQSNDDITSKVVGGSGPLGCNATVESYMSYWQQLKSGLSLLNNRLTTSDPTTLSPKRLEYRIIRALLHSIQVILWSLPGLTQHLGALKQMIAEIWIEIALRVQGDSALQNQIMDTISVLLFPTVPDDSCLTATVGILRKRFRWLYLPILNLDDGSNLVPSNRLKYLLGSSLRGSSTLFQERLADGAVKFVEEKPWEELEKMDLSGPGFISIDALKCQTLSHIEQIPEPKRVVSRPPKSKRGNGDGEETMAEDIEPGGERGSDQQMAGAHALEEEEEENEEEEEIIRGERHCFEHELATDGLSTMPLHFLRSLFPPASRLTGGDWQVTQEQQKLLQTHQAEQTRIQQQQQQQQQQGSSMEVQAEPESGRTRKRKGLGLSPMPVDLATSSSSGPTLRSARSTRKKSSAAAPVNPPPTTASTSKRAKKR
ncbi:uncharacterized protein PGTG_06315 [Puccinia graminis f. sp. tritici CRL 75-36-700-3]|uniref:Mediator of RNA polymerase II transcription subunit 12 n=1 Tax=Puccinia graminis f. sp. tritici (strain CRL 75-36-700-3 / race SCCL) TaxID=418459 RepID=E3K7R1_PUCGT|nr:uncharacterized protein PGTG_06315 [Puccinia graminis f. sp. tritici CRL 75-36-700-3]EFP80359.2 hypothetical protein PGTG_06315 [Puccinia graminis f. sp. tritici CRL 75-36-700-3]